MDDNCYESRRKKVGELGIIEENLSESFAKLLLSWVSVTPQKFRFDCPTVVKNAFRKTFPLTDQMIRC